MTTSSDEPKLSEVKGLLRRLETRTLLVDENEGTREPIRRPGRTSETRLAPGPSSAAMLFLVANTAMATATVTSIGWYLFQSSTMQKRADLSSALSPPRAEPLPPVIATKKAALPESNAPGRAALALRLSAPELLQVATGRSVRVALRLEPADALRTVDQFAFRGLPGDVRLNRGSQVGDQWVVPAGALPDLELGAAAAARAGRFDIVIAARASDGSELAATGATLVITQEPSQSASPAPAAAPLPAAVTLDEETQARHLAKARELLDIGQVGAARLLLQRAADAGSADAALMLGDTYDPLRLYQMQTQGIVGDIDRATFWYERADELGSAEAKARIIGLGRWGP